MSFSLQPKKFVNSEHIGLYAQLELPFGKNQSAVSFKIHYIEEGTGEPVVLIHSAGQSLYTWNAVFKELAGKYRVIAVDLAGHGYSDSSPYCSYSAKEQAAIVGILLTRLGITSAHFVGYSLGCSVVAAFAAANPNKVGRIIMISPGGITPQMPTRIRMLESRVLGSVAALMLTPSAIRTFLSECFLDLTLISDDMVNQYAAPLENGDVKRAARFMALNFDDNEFSGALAKIDAPILVLLASDDKWRTAESVQPYFNILKEGSSAVIRNAGHLMHEEKPDKILAAIYEFFGANNSIDDDLQETPENHEQEADSED